MTTPPILTRPGPEMMQQASCIVDSLGIIGPIHIARASDALLMGALIHAIILHRIGASMTIAAPMLTSARTWVEAQEVTEASLRAIATRSLARTDTQPQTGKADE